MGRAHGKWVIDAHSCRGDLQVRQGVPGSEAELFSNSNNRTSPKTLSSQVQYHLARTLGSELSHETISKITDEIGEEIPVWQRRPLEAFYPVGARPRT